MTDRDVQAIVQFLLNYSPESNVLRWQDVEGFSNFTRQALSANTRIKSAYQTAKKRLAESRKVVVEPVLNYEAPADLLRRIKALEDQVEVLENQRALWRRRWYCIAYHIRQQGIQMFNVDKPVPIGSPVLPDKEVRKILEDFDKDVPPVASHRE
ncbi:hypothetical protein [Pseudomonas plecoglossicida]|uniref:hypothetical protein n=1 Tax=Pseudomonas plecoglossicida TaxID=70775 RepID=UPI00051D3FB7|nr:hypothetical protein [Pseudomonas plecoglossicida]KGK23458.1 hypothetical protein GT93_00865 [Pseudomonas plecoglossicida]